MESSPPRRPGLAKTRGERLVRVRAPVKVSGADGRFRAMFDAADAVSEGGVKVEAHASVWYGTTSLILAWPAELPAASRPFVAAVAAHDPHVRLRAMRRAHQEATLRAPGSLGRVDCEVRMGAEDHGLRIDVEVQAPLTLASDTGAFGPGSSD